MHLHRRRLLSGAAALTGTLVVGSGASARAASPSTSAGASDAVSDAFSIDVADRFAALERRHGARLGVFGYDVRTGVAVRYRADERFPLCSTFKTLAVAAVLRDLDRRGEFLARRVRYTQADIDRSGGAPVTGEKENLKHGMTVAELCAAAVSYSDNTAANLLLRALGGPTAVTRFARSTGDRVTRLDRWEPELNSAEPDRVTDTTTPRAIGTTYARLVLGRVLEPEDRARLTGWLLGNTTSGERFRAGLPDDWVLGDKTGTGSYGTANDVGIAWKPGAPPYGHRSSGRGDRTDPVVLSVLTTKPGEGAAADSQLVAEAAKLMAGALS
ncbi:class A beta-lactamase [Streptomyces sp. Q6]|uniref:Class A beta-lactamase n=1 Tax=Streptomyces citrinus TaxID=3118173 RepID=A0ACD5AF40_9ACTN